MIDESAPAAQAASEAAITAHAVGSERRRIGAARDAATLAASGMIDDLDELAAWSAARAFDLD